jgi:TRAP-type C4-dicarboxylate transport system permease small subunit
MMKQYTLAMDALHRACLVISGVCLVIISLIIPWGVFTRYVLKSASSWPEPMAVLLMIVLSFFSAIVCYREYLHIAVGVIPSALTGLPRVLLGMFVELCMLGTNIFMLWFGIKLVQATWNQTIAEFPSLSAGISYLPIPIAGAITALFVFERIFKGAYFEPPQNDVLETISTE